MHIIKPYGRSHVAHGKARERKRILRLQDGAKTPRDIRDFAESHDELVIAQWISAIDKIATKPHGNKGATSAQRAFRDRLGKACWALVVQKSLLPGLTEPDRKIHLEKLWTFKIAPYGDKRLRSKDTEPSPKGRWYARFAGDADVAKVDVQQIAKRIHEHLYVAEYRLKGDNKQVGRIAARARSIEQNVLRPAEACNNAVDAWSDADWRRYVQAGNVASAIKQAAKAREAAKDHAGTRKVTAVVSAIPLSQQYARIFVGDDGTPLTIKQAKRAEPGLFGLHMDVKDTYSRMLKHHKKSRRSHDKTRRTVSDILPDDMPSLLRLVKQKTKNRDLNALIREGKVIHYEAARTGDKDSPSSIIDNWPQDTSGSFYWSSDGQAEIKRNEAFVRVWRHVLTLAARTLKDWVDPANIRDDDVLLKPGIDYAIGDGFDIDRHSRKLDLLFGVHAGLFKAVGGGRNPKRDSEVSAGRHRRPSPQFISFQGSR